MNDNWADLRWDKLNYLATTGQYPWYVTPCKTHETGLAGLASMCYADGISGVCPQWQGTQNQTLSPTAALQQQFQQHQLAQGTCCPAAMSTAFLRLQAFMSEHLQALPQASSGLLLLSKACS